MKKILLLLFLPLSIIAQNKNVGIGTLTPDSSALLELYSLDKGLLIPRTDTTAIKNPADGLLIYANRSIYYFDAIIWRTLMPKVYVALGITGTTGRKVPTSQYINWLLDISK